MGKKIKNLIVGSIEGTILLVLLGLFVGVLAVAWNQAMNLRQTVAANAAVMNVDPSGLIELEQVRNLAEAAISDSRAYFLMGSKSIFDKQENGKQKFTEALAKFEERSTIPEVKEIVKQIRGISEQEKAFFDQGIEFRDKQTESKIVAQFYHSKTSPLIPQYNEKFEEIVKLQNAALDRSREEGRQAGLDAQAQIPNMMSALTTAMSVLFAAMALLVIRMLWGRRSHLRERSRLVEEAKKAILARDEVIAAASQDMNEPIAALNEISDGLARNPTPSEASSAADEIKIVTGEMKNIVADIYDQKKADMGNLALRVEQMPVADILDDAQVMLAPIAKQRDVSLQFDSVNQSILAYVDKERVLRVLSNLVGNAIKFSPKNSRIAVKVKSDAQFVNISVTDNGTGIPESQIGGIFDNFWQARNTADQGSGVGLAIVKTIIEAHGGTVKAENSHIGKGTVVTFSLPRRRPAGAQIKKPALSGVKRIARATGPIEHADGPTH